jgi:RHS repeat-associated protein
LSAPNGGQFNPNSRLNFAQVAGHKAHFRYQADERTGLIFCTNRWYEPLNARWLTRDPIGYDGGIGLYAYCDGNPSMGADPSGLSFKATDA